MGIESEGEASTLLLFLDLSSLTPDAMLSF